MFTDTWWRRLQPRCYWKMKMICISQPTIKWLWRRLDKRSSASQIQCKASKWESHTSCFFQAGDTTHDPHNCCWLCKVQTNQLASAGFVFFVFFNDNLKTVLYWFNDMQQTNTPVEVVADTSQALFLLVIDHLVTLASPFAIVLLRLPLFPAAVVSWCYFLCLAAGWLVWTTLCSHWFPHQV